MPSVKAQINKDMLAWARESAGFSLEDAARKVATDFKPDQLRTWEEGADSPTFKQLQRLANAYRQSISFFYLPHPPTEREVVHDFRRLPGEVAFVLSPALKLEIRSAFQRRDLALDLLDDIDKEPVPFTLTATIEEDAEDVATRIRQALQVSYAEQVTWRDQEGRKALNAWRQKIETYGVLVFQISGVSRKEMRGLSIAQDILPVIGVNVKDKPRGRTFSLLHEFTHLMLRLSGLCDLDEDANTRPEERRVEVFCNRVASAALLPRDDFLSEEIVAASGTASTTWDDDVLRMLSNRTGTSEEAVLRRLLTLGRTSQEFYALKRREYLARYAELERQDRERAAEADYRRNLAQEAVSNFGKPFTRLVLENYYQKRITLTDVADYLGVFPKHLGRIEQMVGHG